MKILTRVGLGIFLTGFGLWLYTLAMNDFTLTSAIVEKTIKSEHQSTLGVRLQPMLNKTFQNGWAFS